MDDNVQLGNGTLLLFQFIATEAEPPDTLLIVQYSAPSIIANGDNNWSVLGVVVKYLALNSLLTESPVRPIVRSHVASPTGNVNAVLPNFFTQPSTCLLSLSPV